MYASLVTPAKYAFAIWGVIYTWEAVAIGYLLFTPWKVYSSGWHANLWIMANMFQSLWAVLFATERLFLSAFALLGIAASLVALGVCLRGATGPDYWLLAAPIWVHAGWTTAAAIVNVNLVLAAADWTAAAQLAAAFTSSFLALVVGLVVTFAVSLSVDAPSAYASLPLVAALCWALKAIASELSAPDLIKEATAYAQIGEVGRLALQYAVSGCAVVLAVGSVAIAAAGSALTRGGLSCLGGGPSTSSD